jgi:hypothetical protein
LNSNVASKKNTSLKDVTTLTQFDSFKNFHSLCVITSQITSALCSVLQAVFQWIYFFDGETSKIDNNSFFKAQRFFYEIKMMKNRNGKIITKQYNNNKHNCS